MDRKSISEFVSCKESCFANGVQANNKFFTKIYRFKFVARNLQVMATGCVGLHQMYGCGLAMNLITISLILDARCE